jgi:hypothetical protein
MPIHASSIAVGAQKNGAMSFRYYDPMFYKKCEGSSSKLLWNTFDFAQSGCRVFASET